MAVAHHPVLARGPVNVIAHQSPASTKREAPRVGFWKGLLLVPHISDLCLEKAMSLISLGPTHQPDESLAQAQTIPSWYSSGMLEQHQ